MENQLEQHFPSGSDDSSYDGDVEDTYDELESEENSVRSISPIGYPQPQVVNTSTCIINRTVYESFALIDEFRTGKDLPPDLKNLLFALEDKLNYISEISCKEDEKLQRKLKRSSTTTFDDGEDSDDSVVVLNVVKRAKLE